MNLDRMFGLICIFFGLFVVGLVLGEFLIRLFIALIGVFLVNFGMRLRGMAPLHLELLRVWSRHSHM